MEESNSCKILIRKKCICINKDTMFAQNKNFCALVLSKNNDLFAKHACFTAKIRKRENARGATKDLKA